ncbi:MAG: N-acetylmuramoyl-L-alanine amidase, partial [Oligoflexia bacterium]|nr:N-acetylmuramoyl-L-alanine amidase [Oligoflexia bacterium]
LATALDVAFDQAGTDFDVPRDLLVSISYAQTRLHDRSAAEALDSGVGIMNLHLDGTTPGLDHAATLLGRDPDDVMLDPVLSVRAAAALLRSWADQSTAADGSPIDELDEWYPLVAEYSGSAEDSVADGFADQVYDLMQWGFMAQASTGDWLEVRPHELAWRTTWQPVSGSSLISDYVPASTSNYTDSSRTSLTTIVIHTAEGSYSGTINWFQNSAAGASAHYVVRSSDGEITQMVDEEDIAWHAGDWTTNQNSIGIEHEGYTSDPGTWYTDTMYRNSAALVRDIADRYGIPKDRSHIIGHFEVPGCSNSSGGGASCHTDPGDGWDWDYYMSLVNESGTGGGSTATLLPDGPKSGSFQVDATSSRYGRTDHCSGTVEGSANNGTLYLAASCQSQANPDKPPLRIVWSGATMGSTLSGTVVVDSYSDPWTGTVNADGSVTALFTGSRDLGGDIGVVTWSASLSTNP